MPIYRFSIFKQVFDYLKDNLTNVEILPQHPAAVDETKPKIVVEPWRDTAAGRYTTDDIENPDIRITIYATTFLQLTKPTGLIFEIENLMKKFCPNPRQNFDKVSDFYPGYFDDSLMYRAHLVYRFYGDQSAIADP